MILALPNPITLRYFAVHRHGRLAPYDPGVDVDFDADPVILFQDVDLPAFPGAMEVKASVPVTVIHRDHIGVLPVIKAESADEPLFEDFMNLFFVPYLSFAAFSSFFTSSPWVIADPRTA